MKKYIEALKQYADEATTSDAKTGACWEGYERVPNTKKGEPGSCRKIGAEETEADYKYENPKTGEIFIYSRRGTYRKNGTNLIYKGIAGESEAAEYQGRKVTLNKPRRIGKGETSYGKKKSVVYVMDGERVKRVTFGDPNMKIKKNQKGRRSNFRARHNCDTPGPKTKA